MSNSTIFNSLSSVIWQSRSWDDFTNLDLFSQTTTIVITGSIAAAIIAAIQTRRGIKAQSDALQKRLKLSSTGFPEVKPLENFNWENAEPVKLRPFKPKYHLTMADASALQTLDPSELILMDKNYKDRIMYRRQMLKEHHDIVVGVNDDKKIGPAVRELYGFLMATYLPQRYPSMFKVHEANWDQVSAFMLQNLVTGEMFPAQPASTTSTLQLLETLGKHLDEDFLLLLPEDTEKDPRYVMEAYMTVCASGFNPREKMGKRLAGIHEPVPGYGDKLEGSMDRFFAKVEVGKYVQRVNWTVTTNADLYAVGSETVHAYGGDELTALDDIDIDQTFQRTERQTLYRLPRSQALVFAFKTYLYPIKQIKDEGVGEELAQAIDGLKAGNTPEMHHYKRGAVWGEATKRYLRS